MKDQHRLARLLVELRHATDVETSQLQDAFALFKRLTRRERRRLLATYEQLVGRLAIWFAVTCPYSSASRAHAL